MICSTCLISKPLSLCEWRYTIGIIDDDETDVKVRIKNIATGRIDYINTTSDVDGNVNIDYQPMEHQYEIQIINSTTGQPYTFNTTNGIETECIKVHFEISHRTTIEE